MGNKMSIGKALKTVMSSPKGKLMVISGTLSLLGLVGDIVGLIAGVCPDPQAEEVNNEPKSVTVE